MTDNEIIKALECCTNNKCHTDGCPLIGAEVCMGTLTANALSLINRQKAEIEKLREKNKRLFSENVVITHSSKEIKAEAIKEFAERLKKRIYIKKDKALYVEKIDNLVKEMVGDLNG